MHPLPQIPPEIDCVWVGDNDHGLAHLVQGMLDERYDLSVCGLELWCPHPSKAEDRLHCTPCHELATGEMKGYY